MKNKIKSFSEMFVILIVFVIVSYFIQANLDFFTNLIQGYEILGAISYILLAILVTVFAPLTAIPIIPLISALYGWVLTGLFNFIGWFIGSLIIFYICRKWGKPILKKFISLEKVKKFENSVSNENKVFTLILLRMIFPADVLSYALSLFTNISWKIYILVTFIGMLPFAFILAYLGELNFIYQITGLIIIVIIFLIIILIKTLQNKKPQP